MQNWTTEIGVAALLGLIIGAGLSYVILRLTKGSVKKQAETEAELQKVKSELNEQKQQIENHFAQSADLLKTMAQDYQKLYRHLSDSSARLLPELSDKPLFPQNLISAENPPPTEDQKKGDNQPRDYSDGSSGILKAEH